MSPSMNPTEVVVKSAVHSVKKAELHTEGIRRPEHSSVMQVLHVESRCKANSSKATRRK